MKRKNQIMAIDLKTDISLPYVDSEDAFDLFTTVVENGQTRLALEVLVDILVAVLNKVNELDETVSAIVEFLSEDDSETESTEKQTVLEEEVNRTEESQIEKKETETKTVKQKDSTKKTQTEEVSTEKI